MSRSRDTIVLRGVRQHNLKNFDIEIPVGELVVVTGVSGSGKSSLAFDTLYAEGQRRYVETFSAYARQFLDRMDRPDIDRIEGIPPAVAIDQTNPVRTSRSIVATMTGISDYMKVMYARMGVLYCAGCGRPVTADSPVHIVEDMINRIDGEPIMITFPLRLPEDVLVADTVASLLSQGLIRVRRYGAIERIDEIADQIGADDVIDVVLDRTTVSSRRRSRIIGSVEQAVRLGHGTVKVVTAGGDEKMYSCGLHCPDCNISYRPAVPNLFSFNSPLGACPECRGFGRTIEIDPALVIPDKSVSIDDDAIRAWTGKFSSACKRDLQKWCRENGVRTDVPYGNLPPDVQRTIYDGEQTGWWYGVKGFFEWLEGRTYRMHVRVFLSKFRAYVPCTKCGGARLRQESLQYRLGPHTVADVYAMPISETKTFFREFHPRESMDKPAKLLLNEICARLDYMVDVGLGYLTLDRQSRTLSGGEVERVSLTTALGTSLVNTLYVLDEPSIGLHQRDIERLIGVLHRLRDLGNTVVVVEHDMSVIRAADTIIDMGPGPGRYGGTVVYSGAVKALPRRRKSKTAAYLRGDTRIDVPEQRRSVDETRMLRVVGATEHNLRQIDVSIPLDRFVCVTGVSGSGKSTLVVDVVYRSLAREKGHRDAVGSSVNAEVHGADLIKDVVLMDQTPVGPTPRSNPASYVKAFDGIRRWFADSDDARRKGYGPGAFSFNSSAGRCPQCGGLGYEKIEMQFLSDVYVKCAACNGTRYDSDVLDVRRNGVNIADLLDMTVDEAIDFFDGYGPVVWQLEPLRDVGLGYIRLGQPGNTMSGGEAQRMKLARHIARATHERTLFLFDEPTTGLHAADVDVLLKALNALVDLGHSVLVIEHNLDVVKCADYVIDLGPEGGDDGGRVVATGTPEQVSRVGESHTGRFLTRVLAGKEPVVSRRKPRTRPKLRAGKISIYHAREHNLRDVSLDIPRDNFVVVTGVSGSGKSTLVFDILFAEGQRRYLDTLNAYARQYMRQLSRPDVDHIEGIPPTVAIEQRKSRGGRKSTVATMTEIYHFLRLLFAKVGTVYCPECDVPVEPDSSESVARKIARAFSGRTVDIMAPVVVARKGFHKDVAERAERNGYQWMRVDGKRVRTDRFPKLERYREHTIEFVIDRIELTGPRRPAGLRRAIDRAATVGNGVVIAARARGRDAMYNMRRSCPRCNRSFTEPDPRLFSFNSWLGACKRCGGTGRDDRGRPCRACGGTRLSDDALAVRLDGRNISELTALAIDKLEPVLSDIKWPARHKSVVRPVLAEINARLDFLENVGLGYLTLDRSADTLSGGETQRVRLAAQLGSNLRGACYILDEPTIGLHPRDNDRLIRTLRNLRDRGNSVVVVEHDEATIRAADYIIDLGPRAGTHGGRVVVTGTLNAIKRDKKSVTGQSLKKPILHPSRGERRPIDRVKWITVRNARQNNLKGIDVRVPLGRLVCVTGVSGSGKSTLVTEVIYRGLRRKLGFKTVRPGQHKSILGSNHIDRVQQVDQSPIGRTPRSIPATYVGLFDEVRRLFAMTPDARARDYRANRFSFNVKTGRCERCRGQGRLKVEMSFLPDVQVPCEECGGARYSDDTLAVTFKGKTIADVLDMTVEEGVGFFAAIPKIARPLELLNDIGLGYIKLGQPSPELSGGEAQRIKLAAELHKTGRGHTVYFLEEPTTGLHTADIVHLMTVLHRIVDAGNSVIVVEHNLDVVAESDYIIDLGPESGDQGGSVVAEGTPETLIRHTDLSHTARALKEFLAQHSTSAKPSAM